MRERLSPTNKRAAVLRTLLERGDRGLSCFEAVTACHDYVLRTTISSLCSDYGLTIPRRFERVTGHGGGKVDACRYTLTAEDAAKARELLGMVTEPTERSVASHALSASLGGV